ncbi:hypothetical protein PYK22_02002 [Pyrinomonas methylaliphatogenes]|uniref:Uncharacterized protein n=1 Tax=Pyrinomonas methylaliphatogenes TaxID=454194 RepID=A0A0B6WXK3_9BACT|nr:hypothetical protein PYK22_02002 [Pyrinomonas methylaliphatogenes]
MISTPKRGERRKATDRIADDFRLSLNYFGETVRRPLIMRGVMR